MLSLTVPPVMAGVPLGFLPYLLCLTAMWLILKPYGLPTDIPTPWGESISFVDIKDYPGISRDKYETEEAHLLGGGPHGEDGGDDDSLLNMNVLLEKNTGTYFELQAMEDGTPPLPYGPELRQLRNGRMGLAFLMTAVMGCYAGARIFLPDRQSKREKEMEKKREKAAEKEEIWRPNMWKRSNFLFTSFMVCMYLLIVIEFSYWGEFGTYIWWIIMAFNVTDQLVGMIVDEQVKEALLSAPIMTTSGMVSGIVTLSADDFLDFLFGYFVELGMAILFIMNIDPALSAVLEWFGEFFGSLQERIMKFLPKWMIGRGLPENEAKAGEGEDGEKGYAKRELEGLVAEGGETVEPILDSFGSYSCDCVSLLYSPFVILFLMLYREETGLGEAYGIKEQDMRNYFNFAYVVIPFQFVADVFIHSSLELYHGWKIYDYLIYTRYRYLQRETRWKGMEDSLDECIDESVRTLDQMCFSDQYYMMITIQVNGMTMLVLGVQMMLRAEYNFIGDPGALVIIPLVFAIAYFIEWFIIKLALRFNLYRIKHENTAWHTQLAEDDEFDIPGWEDLQGASHDAYLMNQRITSETFRFKFLNYNRSWLINQLPSILTPRTLRRSRPYLINQFTRILNQLNQDISSDSDDGDA